MPQLTDVVLPYTQVGQVVKTDFGEVTVDNRCWIRTGHTLTQVISGLW